MSREMVGTAITNYPPQTTTTAASDDDRHPAEFSTTSEEWELESQSGKKTRRMICPPSVPSRLQRPTGPGAFPLTCLPSRKKSINKNRFCNLVL